MMEKKQEPLIRSMDILQYPKEEELLRTVSTEVTDFEEAKEICDKIHRTMALHSNCMALAAIQLGFPKRIFVMKWGGDLVNFINPKLGSHKGITFFSEACMSFNMGLDIVKRKRKKKIAVSFKDVNGNRRKIKFHGIEAVCVQHEVDHLDGKLLID